MLQVSETLESIKGTLGLSSQPERPPTFWEEISNYCQLSWTMVGQPFLLFFSFELTFLVENCLFYWVLSGWSVFCRTGKFVKLYSF